jgi:negative regulator of sigma-B (phosphoserine phosphatase)
VQLTLATASYSRPKVGETANGDAALVRADGGRTLLAVIDALGHGPAAAEATARALEVLGRADLSGSITGLFDAMHRALHGSRGAAVTACVFDGAVLRGAGVGNVALRSLGTDVPALITPGIVGGPRAARVRAFEARLAPGDKLALFSDGIASSFDLDGAVRAEPGAACRAIVGQWGRAYDDATVLLAYVLAAR